VRSSEEIIVVKFNGERSIPFARKKYPKISVRSQTTMCEARYMYPQQSNRYDDG
jgi:hypothetical protein